MTAFIILHYKNIQDTYACIESIKKLDGPKKIIVVDNATLNQDEIKELEKKVDNLICLKENIGFAKANNKGCQLAVKEYQPDFLVVINNDTEIRQQDFLKRIQEIYKRTKFDILGPKILCKEGSGSVNPYRPLKNINEVNQEIEYQKKLVKFYKSGILYFLLKIFVYTKSKIVHPKVLKNGVKEKYNVALHGCALIFSRQYYNKHADIFINDTFLYHEEDLLYHRIQKEKLRSVYSPNIELIHKEGGSLNVLFQKNNRKKLLFRTKEIIKSLEILKKEMTKE